MIRTPVQDIRHFLRHLSPRDFLKIGMNEVAYIKPVQNAHFCIHAADGTPISLMDSQEEALAALRSHDLMPMTLH